MWQGKKQDAILALLCMIGWESVLAGMDYQLTRDGGSVDPAGPA